MRQNGNHNPYAPPRADTADMPAPDVPAPPYFAVSIVKLLVLSLCTMGLYEFYWFSRNWQSIRLRERSDISPFWRTFFAVLFCYSCFKHIRDSGVERNIGPTLAAGPLAAGWIIVTIAWGLPDPYSLVTFLAVLFFVPVQLQVNRINAAAAPAHDPNSRFSAWNWVAVAIGGLTLVLVIIAAFMPDAT